MSNSDLIAVVDVETTGLSPWRNDRIIEIAVLLMSPDGVVHQEYETLVNPERDLGPSRIHHITAGEILHAPKFADIAGDIAALLSRANVLAGHNVSFDKNFLIEEYRRLGITMPDIPVLCTCQRLGRNNLVACCEEFDIAFEGAPHRAISDARAAASLLRRLIDDDPATLDEFHLPGRIWPAMPQRRTACVTRDIAQKQLREPPAFLQRIASKTHHDADATIPSLIAYLALIDRVLEDRTIDANEESTLVEAIDKWGLTMLQVKDAHRTYINNFVAHALADGIVTEAERSDLHQVARLLGQDDRELDQILESAAAQLRTTKSAPLRTSSSDELLGKRICFTGEILSRINGEPITRGVAEALAEHAGLVVSNNVTKNLDLLIVADPNTQSGKAKKARQYGTRIIADSVFWRMIGVTVK